MAAPQRNTAELGNRLGRLWPASILLGWAPLVFFALVGALSLAFRNNVGHGFSSRPAQVIGVALALAVLTRRLQRPELVLAIVLVIAAAVDFAPMTPLLLLALLAIAMLRSRREATVAAAASAVVEIVTPALHGHALTNSAEIVSRLVSVGLAIALGFYLRARADYISGLHDRTERLERERELLARQAVADERVRIARELHDAVAHSVSLMVVQAQALAAGGVDPQQRASLQRIAGLGREAMSEMRHMLGVLRPDGLERPERAPQPGIGDLDALIQQVRASGLRAALHIEGDARPLSAGVDLSAYRIVQEALTNVIRHADADSAEVTVRYGPSVLELQIADDGVGPGNGANGAGGGQGLVGMGERVALFGGELSTGPGPDGRGYLVHAVLPLH